MPRVEVECSTTVNVAITCESCGHQYQRKTVVSAEQQPLLDPLTGNSDLRVKLQKKLSKFNQNDFSELPNFKCPECGYTQSWNIKGSQKEIAENAGWILAGVIGLAIFITSLINGTNFLAILLLSLLLVGLLGKIFKLILVPLVSLVHNPNKNKETAFKTIYPDITN